MKLNRRGSTPANDADYGEAKAKTVQRVRGEFLSDTFKPKITFAYNTVTFNMACVNFFKDCQHVSLGIDLKNKRLIDKDVNKTLQAVKDR